VLINKKISVAMTTYNGVAFLEKQLDSILSQTVKVSEIIVCDDCSTDGTLQLLEKYAERGELTYVSNNQNLGFVKNFEKALSLCSGDYILLADQDDIWYAKKVEVLIYSIADNLLIHSDCDLIDVLDEVIQPNFKGILKTHQIADDFLFANVVTGCTVMMHKDLLDYALPFPEGLVYHDWYLGLHAAYRGKISYLAQTLIGYRQHHLQDTGSGEKSSILRNCWSRIIGREFQEINSSKKQLINLRASLPVFSDDPDFQEKHRKLIRALEGYVKGFFHFSYGYWFARTFVLPNESVLKRVFYRLKYSIG